MSTPRWTAIILAAGSGTRMKTTLPKVLHRLAGRPMIDYALRAALDAGAKNPIIVLGHERERIEKQLRETFGDQFHVAIQEEPLGTGHAVQCALPLLTDVDRVWILHGDTVLLDPKWLPRMNTGSLLVTTSRPTNPSGFGRIVRNWDPHTRTVRVTGILEGAIKYAHLDEVNVGIYAASVPLLQTLAPSLKRSHGGEILFTDIVEAAAQLPQGVDDAFLDSSSFLSINTLPDLHRTDEQMYRRIAEEWRANGVLVGRGARIDRDAVLQPDVVIESHVAIRGKSQIASGTQVDVGCVIDNTSIGRNVTIRPYSVITKSVVHDDAQIGPFAHVRAGSEIGSRAQVGNFVETKATFMGPGAKACHLAYIGDGTIGEGANIGAGTIFCNYDGFRKSKTVVGAGVFIGSDSQLVAPVTIGEGAIVAAGSTITEDIPPNALALTRPPLVVKPDGATKFREKRKDGSELPKK